MPKRYTKEEFQKKYAGYTHVNAGIHYMKDGSATFDYMFGSASQILSYANSKGDDLMYIVTK